MPSMCYVFKVVHWLSWLSGVYVLTETELPVLLQIQGSIQAKGVSVLAKADQKLEDASVLAKLDQQKEPDEVMDSNGEVAQDCKEVKPVSSITVVISVNHQSVASVLAKLDQQKDCGKSWPPMARWLRTAKDKPKHQA